MNQAHEPCVIKKRAKIHTNGTQKDTLEDSFQKMEDNPFESGKIYFFNEMMSIQ